MKILTHAVHTSWEYEFAKTGHQIYSVDLGALGGAWNTQQRPKPDNVHLIDKECFDNGIGFNDKKVWGESDFDIAIAHTQVGYNFFKDMKIPLIYKLHTVDAEKKVDEDIEKRVNFFCFNNKEASDKWIFKDINKKRIIEHSIDTNVFCNYNGKIKKILCVGNKLPIRLDKGVENIRKLAERYEVVVCGQGNEGFQGVKGIELIEPKNLFELAEAFRNHEIFFNPADTLPMSQLEAMATGMPTIGFKARNSKNLIVCGVNGFQFDSFEKICQAIELISARPCVAKGIGEKGRKTIETRYNTNRFVREWNDILEIAVQQGYLHE